MRLIPTSITHKTADPTGGMTLDALMARQKALAQNAPTAPAQIASPWQGAAFMANSFVNSLQQKQAQDQEAAGRQKLAELMGGINYDTGATPEQIAGLSQLDPDISTRMVADAISARRQKANQEHNDALTREGWAHQDATQRAGFEHTDTAAAAAAAQPDSPTAKILNDFKLGNYGDQNDPVAIQRRDADIAKATNIQRPGSKASDLKTRYTQEDDLASYEETLNNLDRATALNPKVPVGRVAQSQATLHGNLPEGSPEWLVGSNEAADASKEFWQIMDENAIAQMSAKLKGATTDTELAQFKQILSDPSTSVNVRQTTIDRMKSLLVRQRDMAKARLDDILASEGGGPAAPGATPAPAPTATPAPAPAPAPAPTAAAPDLTNVPEGAVLDLKNDPSLAPFFDQKYGAGAAAKILGTGGR